MKKLIFTPEERIDHAKAEINRLIGRKKSKKLREVNLVGVVSDDPFMSVLLEKKGRLYLGNSKRSQSGLNPDPINHKTAISIAVSRALDNVLKNPKDNPKAVLFP